MEAAHSERIAVLETKHDSLDDRIIELSESVRWLTRSIFGLMGSIVLAIGVFVAQGGSVGT